MPRCFQPRSMVCSCAMAGWPASIGAVSAVDQRVDLDAGHGAGSVVNTGEVSSTSP